jgi:hypothetical protein
MLAGYSYDNLAYLWVGTLLGGIAAGGAGFAFGLATSAVWLHRIDPLHSTILINGCGLLLHLTTIWPQRQHVELSRLCPSWSAAWPAFRSASICLPTPMPGRSR